MVDRIVDFGSVALISVAAVMTALCGYQSGRWSGQQTRLYNLANAVRVEASEASDRMNVMASINVTLFLHYIDAIDAHDQRKAQFIYRRLPADMKPAMDAWLATKPLVNPRAPTSPFVMPQYALHTKAELRRLQTSAAANFSAAQTANEHADNFLLLTVIFAGVSFLAGVSTKMTYPRHALVVTIAMIGLVYGAIRLVELPFL